MFLIFKSFYLHKHTQVFEEPVTQPDSSQGLEQTGPPTVNPVITINDRDKVSRHKHTHTHSIQSHLSSCVSCFLCCISNFLRSFFFLTLSHLKVASSVNRSGRMNLFSLMQSISELDDGDKVQVNSRVPVQSVSFSLDSLAVLNIQMADL